MLQVKRTFLCCRHKLAGFSAPTCIHDFWASYLIWVHMYYSFIPLPSCFFLPLQPMALLPTKQGANARLGTAVLEQVAHKSQTGCYTCWWGPKNSAHFRDSGQITSHTTAQRALLWRRIWGWGRLDEVCALPSASCYRECGNTFLNNKFKFSSSLTQATGGNVLLYINTGELLPLKS